MAETAEAAVARCLREGKRTIGFAESCTGGLVSHRITNVPGSSAYFVGSVISYGNGVKSSVLDVPAELIENHGAVSRQVAKAMADGARKVLGTDFAAAVTGVAGPGGGTAKKPVGLAYIAFSSGDVCRTKKIQLDGNRVALKLKFAQSVLEFVKENLLQN